MELAPGQIPMGLLPAHHAQAGPDRPAVTMGEDSLSWSQLEARANQRARAYQSLGVRAGDFVTIALPNGFEFYETAFAIWKLGATPNVVSSKLPRAELDAILELVRPSLLVADLPEAPAGITMYAKDSQAHLSHPADPVRVQVAAHWKAMTSGGSTGRPKVIVDHNPAAWDPTAGALLQQPGNTVLNPGPLYHNAPFSVMHAALFVGGHVVEMGRFDPLRALELIERHRVEWVNLVPTMMNRIWRLPEDQRKAFDLSSLRTVFHMASACPPWLKERWIEWLGPERIWELYGGTERQGSTVIGGAEWLTHRGSVGRVQPGSRMQVMNEAGEPCAPGEVGEVFFLPDLGAGATYHYVGADPKRQGEWESIGDLGYLDEEGYLYLVDRRTDMIVSGGANVYPAEVEAALDAHPGIASSAVIGLPDDDLGQRVHAIVQASPTTGAPDLEELRSFLAERLVRYKIPRSFEIVEEPLRDDAGKTRRSALREVRLAGSPRG
ncbi:AMP-binding protein [Quisquiliibacterium transsilvanicum]|uniref:Bile acid-coenzyme A ligase n=1 Tax=Quisquiliibacterium transsilvanicum TaxID=1549638 RepID=A0A7W8HIQ1_9BURK|nr:AMP-binding protein [Quisquiliibacterium transsilvanicum]MBB5271973.1 bile acid-coenzyme A ligase [Quisquiliibacterium transsilvanicum]